LSGAVCAAVVGTTPAVADDHPVVAPVGQLPILPGTAPGPGSDQLGAFDFGSPVLAQADTLAQVFTGQQVPDPARSVLTAFGLPPVAVAATPAVATPITEPAPVPPPVLPGNQLRIGSVQVDRPDFIPADIAVQIND